MPVFCVSVRLMGEIYRHRIAVNEKRPLRNEVPLAIRAPRFVNFYLPAGNDAVETGNV